MIAFAPILACGGLHLLAAGAVLAGWATMGIAGAGVIVLAVLALPLLLWRRRSGTRCSVATKGIRRDNDAP